MIGVSNTHDVRLLQLLEREGGRKAQIVQNRWYEGNDWDKDVLRYCTEQGISYQYIRVFHLTYNATVLIWSIRSFWTLSGSPKLLQSAQIRTICNAVGCTSAQAVYRLAQTCGIVPLSGTTKEQHMKDDVLVEKINLEAQGSVEVDEAVQVVMKLLRGL